MIVLDSSFLIAYHNTRDVRHAEAARARVHLVAGQWGTALLLEYVFLEVMTVLRARRGHAVALDVADTLLDASEIEFVPCADFFTDTMRTFRAESADISFTDAAIVTVARREKQSVIATFDQDFRNVEGVIVVPS
jgi:predicted nucleic acid-binding protein